MAKLISKFIRVAVEGDTIDGREITREQIDQMAETYDPKRFGARINNEHFLSFVPGGPFDALGDVVALKSEDVVEEGELKGKRALYAQLAPLPSLVRMNQAGQKVYSSIEMITNFAKSGKAYMVGLAVTDSPASQGTEMLSFNQAGADVIAGAEHEVALEFIDEDEPKDDKGEGKPALFTKVKALLAGKSKTDAAQFADINQSVELIAESQQSALEASAAMQTALDQSAEQFTTLQTAHDELKTDFAALKEQLEKNPAATFTPRSPASGGDGKELADC